MKIDFLIFIVNNLIVAFDCADLSDIASSPSINSRKEVPSPKNKIIPKLKHYTIAALFPIHNAKLGYESCGTDIDEYEFQVVEAAYFAVDSINRNDSILSSVNLSINIEDYCNSHEMAELQIKKLFQKERFSFNDTGIETSLIGIIGLEDRESARKIESWSSKYSVVQIYYSDPLPYSDLTTGHEYFFSMTPVREYMTDAIIEILVANNWTHVSLFYSEDKFEEADLKHFQSVALERNICIEDIVGNYTKVESSKHIQDIMPSYDKVDVVVCFCSPKWVDWLFHMIKDRDDETNRFVVINGGGWSPSHPPEHQDVAVGEILVSVEQAYITEFDNHFSSLNLNSNSKNSLLDEFWQHHFNCEINSSEESKLSKCSGNESLSDGYKRNPKVRYVIESVYVLAYALHDMIKRGCENVSPDKLQKENKFYKLCYMDRVSRVRFDLYGKSIVFNRDRGFPKITKFNILNFQYLGNGSYDYVQIGEYIRSSENSTGENLKMNITELVYPGNKTTFQSSCNVACGPHEARVSNNHKCCWDCVPCKPLEILVNSSSCGSCPFGYMPNSDRKNCIPKRNVIAVSFVFSSLSIISALFTFCIFIKNQNTPAVKSSTKELCYMMFVGMIFANLTPFITLQTPNSINCAIVRVLPSISFTLIYAALLVKTNRIARILAISKKKFPNLNPKFLSLRAQILFTISLFAIEVLICLYSLWKYSFEPLNIFQHGNNSYHGVRICPLSEEIMFLIFAFIGVLILICTYYAIKTRNLPENFNEAKYIGFSMYTTILTDVSFGLIYLGSELKIFAINLCISVNTLILLIFLFAPKLYVILWVPEKNTRVHFITTTSIRCFIAKYQKSSEPEPSDSKNRY